MLISLWQWFRGKLSFTAIVEQKWLLLAWIFAAPLGYIAVETGWIVRCVGRQPWVVYGEMRTVNAASSLPAGEVLFSLVGLTSFYCLFFIAALYFGSRIVRRGPNLQLPDPRVPNRSTLNVAPAQHEPDSRPAEAQR